MVKYPPRGKDRKRRNLTPLYTFHLLNNKDFLDLGDVDRNEFKQNVQSMESIRKGDYTKLTKLLSVIIRLPQNQDIRNNNKAKEEEDLTDIFNRLL